MLALRKRWPKNKPVLTNWNGMFELEVRIFVRCQMTTQFLTEKMKIASSNKSLQGKDPLAYSLEYLLKNDQIDFIVVVRVLRGDVWAGM